MTVRAMGIRRTGSDHLHLKPGAEEVNIFVNEHEKNGCGGQEVFHQEKDERPVGKIVGHHRIDLCRSPLDQLKRQERVENAQNHHHQNDAPTSRVMLLSRPASIGEPFLPESIPFPSTSPIPISGLRPSRIEDPCPPPFFSQRNIRTTAKGGPAIGKNRDDL